MCVKHWKETDSWHQQYNKQLLELPLQKKVCHHMKCWGMVAGACGLGFWGGGGGGGRPAHVLEVALHCSKLSLQAADVCLLLHHSLLQNMIALQAGILFSSIISRHCLFGCMCL